MNIRNEYLLYGSRTQFTICIKKQQNQICYSSNMLCTSNDDRIMLSVVYSDVTTIVSNLFLGDHAQVCSYGYKGLDF